MPPTGITGATFHGGRLFVAGQAGDLFQVWSIDLATGSRQLEIERTVIGKSYPPLNGTLLHFAPAAGA